MKNPSMMSLDELPICQGMFFGLLFLEDEKIAGWVLMELYDLDDKGICMLVKTFLIFQLTFINGKLCLLITPNPCPKGKS